MSRRLPPLAARTVFGALSREIPNPGVAHNKVMVIDGATVITGSFNFTKAEEEHNAENMLVIRDSALAAKYAANWQAHVEHSEAYEGRQEDGSPAEKPTRKRMAA